jgi:hypothetical protein
MYSTYRVLCDICNITLEDDATLPRVNYVAELHQTLKGHAVQTKPVISYGIED